MEQYELEQREVRATALLQIQSASRRRASVVESRSIRSRAAGAFARARRRTKALRSAKVKMRCVVAFMQGAKRRAPTPGSPDGLDEDRADTPAGRRRSLVFVARRPCDPTARFTPDDPNIYEEGWMRCQALARGAATRRRNVYRFDDERSVDSKAEPPVVVVRPATPTPPAWMVGLARIQAIARGALLRSLRPRRPASPYGVDLEYETAVSSGRETPRTPRTPRSGGRPPVRTLKEHRRAEREAAAQFRAASRQGSAGSARSGGAAGAAGVVVPRVGVGDMGALGGGTAKTISVGAVIAMRRGAYNVDVRTPRFGGPLDILGPGCDRDSYAPHRPDGAALDQTRGRNGRVTSSLLAALRNDLADHATPTFARGIDGPPLFSGGTRAKTAAAASRLDDDDATFLTAAAPYLAHTYHVPIDVSVGSYLAPSRPHAEPSTAHRDRWLATTRGSHRSKRTKQDKLYREARRHVVRLVKQNRRLASANGV